MFNQYTYHNIVKIVRFENPRNFYWDQTNGDCFLQVTSGNKDHYQSCVICQERLLLIAEEMRHVSKFQFFRMDFPDADSNGIYVRFNPGPSISPFVFLKDVLQRDVVRTENKGLAKLPFACEYMDL